MPARISATQLPRLSVWEPLLSSKISPSQAFARKIAKHGDKVVTRSSDAARLKQVQRQWNFMTHVLIG